MGFPAVEKISIAFLIMTTKYADDFIEKSSIYSVLKLLK